LEELKKEKTVRYAEFFKMIEGMTKPP